jgi:DNA recombination protein RmuC
MIQNFDQTVAVIGGVPVSLGAALGAACVVVLAIGVIRARAGRRRDANVAAERQRELEGRIAELSGGMRSMAEVLGSRQADLARLVSERLDHVGARVGAGLESSARSAGESLAKLNERLAVIDAAQARLAGLTQEVVGLKDMLANKQQRGAFGQGRMEAIVRDGLPAGAYDFQYTLSNKTRPDCVIRLPGDPRLMAVDSKFPLEAFTLFKDSRGDEARKAASARVRADVGKHVRDIAERYLLPGETQDLAMMFVPSESVYSDLVEHFDDVVQKAHRGRVVIVSPSLLMMAIQVMQTIVRDARMREQAHVIQSEVGKLLNDVRLLAERAGRLDQHFRQAQEDIAQVTLSSEKIARRGERIDAMDFADAPAATEPTLRLARGS